MTFLAPWAAWFAAGIPVIILLYLLKLKRRPVGVSTLIFWQRILRETRRRALFQRLRLLLSLLLHLLIFLLILAALARPESNKSLSARGSTVIVIDSRARMQAIDSRGQSDFAEAIRRATQSLHSAGAARQIALISADGSAEVMAPFTGDERLLEQGLARIAVTDSSGSLDPAITLANDLLASRNGTGEIIVFTNEADVSPPAIASPVRVERIGTPRDNLAITNFAARPVPNNPQTSQVLLTTQNFGRQHVRGNVEISLDGRVIEVKPFDLEPGAHLTEIISIVPPNTANARGWLTAKLDTHDGLALDDAAFATLPAAHPRRVLLVTRGHFFLEKLLSADDSTQYELLGPEAYRAEMGPHFDAVIFDNFVPAGFDVADSHGNFLFLGGSPFASSGSIEAPLITESDSGSPLLRLIDLQNINILNARIMSLPEPRAGWHFEAPLRSLDHPLIITAARPTDSGGQRIAAFAFDVAKSDLPLRVAFPLLISNTLQWLAGEDSRAAESVRAGETITLLPGQTITAAPVPPDAAEGDLERTVFRPLHNGFYLTRRGDRQEWMAVNTFGPAESDLSQKPSQQESSSGSANRLPVGLVWDWWVYLALAAFALFSWEWWLFHRRATE